MGARFRGVSWSGWRCLALVVSVTVCLPACDTIEPPVASLEIEPRELRLDYSEVRTLRLRWTIRRELEGLTGDPSVFVHLLGEPGEVLRTFDHPFPEAWQLGRIVESELRIHQSALGPPLEPGAYSLSLGLYDQAGRRWALDVQGDEIDEAEYELAELRVDDTTEAPRFRFSESWGPIEPGLDRQILGRRWLSDHGSISLTGLTGSGTVWMILVVPSVEPGVRRLVLDSGFDQSRVLLRSLCGGSEVEVTGEGRHEIEIPLRPDLPEDADTESGVECELFFEPNFHLVTPGSPDRRAVLLETLAWASGRGPGDRSATPR